MNVIPITKEGHMDLFSALLNERIVLLTGPITDETVTIVNASFIYLDSLSHEEIQLYINSPGGDTAGLSIISTMHSIKSPVTTVCMGRAASMSAVILSAGKRRVALKYSEIMLHAPWQGGHEGPLKVEDLSIAAEHLTKVKKDIYEVLAKNCNKTVVEIEGICAKGDKFLSPEEALALGLIDEVLD